MLVNILVDLIFLRILLSLILLFIAFLLGKYYNLFQKSDKAAFNNIHMPKFVRNFINNFLDKVGT